MKRTGVIIQTIIRDAFAYEYEIKERMSLFVAGSLRW